MEDVFRFVVVRTPQKPADGATAAVSDDQSAVQAAIAQGGQKGDAAAAADQQIAEGEVATSLGQVGLGPPALAFFQSVSGLGAGLDASKAAAAVKAHFGESPRMLRRRAAFTKDWLAVKDAVVAIAAAGKEDLYPLADFANAARAFALVWRLAENPREPADRLARTLAATLVLPEAARKAAPPPADGGTDGGGADADDGVTPRPGDKDRAAALDRIRALDQAIEMIGAARRAPPPQPALTTVEAVAAVAPAQPGLVTRGLRALFGYRPPAPAVRQAAVFAPEKRTLALLNQDGLPAPVKAELDALGPPDQVYLEEADQITSLLRDRMWHQYGGVPHGSTAVTIGSTTVSDRNAPPPPGPSPEDEPPPANLPTGDARIQGVGWADLKVVRQQLVRYEPTEIAHVENVLKSEIRNRIVKRTRTTEQTTTEETERTTTEERDLQTTDRFELKRETSIVLKEDSSLKTGLSVSAHYGSYLDVTATVGYQLDQSKEEASKHASTYAKDVTERAASRITERVRKEQVRRVTEILAEEDQHGFKNDTGPAIANISGIYQWLDKIYRAQVFNYGARFLYDITVPEPAAFLIDAMMHPAGADQVLIEPDPFTLHPADISDGAGPLVEREDGPAPETSDYRHLVAKYQASGIAPPPAPEVVVTVSAASKVEEEGGEEKQKTGAQTVKELTVKAPDGHLIRRIVVRAKLSGAQGVQTPHLFVLAGSQAWSYTLGSDGHPRSEEVYPAEQLAVAITADGVAHYALTLEAYCYPTPRAIEQWQLGVHAGIVAAYLKLKADYEDKLASRRLDQARAFGSNPGRNRQLEVAELKKHCLTILTRQHFGWVGAVSQPSTPGYPRDFPQVDLSRSDPRGSYIRFFEQAFEWEHLVFKLYPYFWGRKTRWYDRVLLDDNDPQFAEFLRAGAARVVLPVRPGFEQAVAHYLDSGALWNGEAFVNVASPLYVPVVEEIKAAQDAAGKPPQAEGEPWEVRVPTTLVKLRRDDALPFWTEKTDPQTGRKSWEPGP